MKKRQPSQEALQAQLLARIANGARQCREVEAEFGRNPAPSVETLIKIHRVLVLKLSNQANLDPDALRQVTELMKPVMEFARLEEKRKDRELAERKHQELLAARDAARAKTETAESAHALRQETLEKIEHELNLF
jgi:hypothetical protein